MSAPDPAGPALRGLAIGVDIGGTKVAAGVVDDDGRVVAQLRRPTPSQSPAEVEAVVREVIAALRADHDVVAVGVGAAGWVDADRATVVFAPNLAWRNEPLRDRVSEGLDLPVVVENDANAAAWAEHRFGAARGEAHVVAITVGTGIGAGFVLDGRLYRGRFGMAAEPGHLHVVPDGHDCGCGNKGCWEQYASGTALTRIARESAMRDEAAGARLREIAGGDLADLDGHGVTTAAQEGDALACAAFAQVGAALGAGLADLAALLDPGVFVIGGGVAEAGDLLLVPTCEAYERTLAGRGNRPVADVRVASLGNDAGLVGAADLARQG